MASMTIGFMRMGLLFFEAFAPDSSSWAAEGQGRKSSAMTSARTGPAKRFMLMVSSLLRWTRATVNNLKVSPMAGPCLAIALAVACAGHGGMRETLGKMDLLFIYVAGTGVPLARAQDDPDQEKRWQSWLQEEIDGENLADAVVDGVLEAASAPGLPFGLTQAPASPVHGTLRLFIERYGLSLKEKKPDELLVVVWAEVRDPGGKPVFKKKFDCRTRSVLPAEPHGAVDLPPAFEGLGRECGIALVKTLRKRVIRTRRRAPRGRRTAPAGPVRCSPRRGEHRREPGSPG